MITFTGLQQALDEYGERTSTDTEDVDRKIAAMRVAMQVLAILRGIGADDIDAEIEEALLRPVPGTGNGSSPIHRCCAQPSSVIWPMRTSCSKLRSAR